MKLGRLRWLVIAALAAAVAWSMPHGGETLQAAPPAPAAVCEGELPKDQATQVSRDCTVMGDVEVSLGADGPFSYFSDNEDTTGFAVTPRQPAFFKAQFGAGVSPNNWGQLVNEMLKSGCLGEAQGGCAEITHLYWAAYTDTSRAPDGGVKSDAVCPGEIAAGQTALVPAGCVVLGDASFSRTISGTFTLYTDQLDTTGLATLLMTPAYVRAGADYAVGTSPDPLGSLVNAMLDKGCLGEAQGGCIAVTALERGDYTDAQQAPTPRLWLANIRR